LEDAALSPLSGQILAIGALTDGVPMFWYGAEKNLLTDFCTYVESRLVGKKVLVGFNCHSFDWPFIVKRCWANGVKVSSALRDGRYWNRQLIDLRELWQLGDRQAEGGLDAISKFFGGPGKTGSGSDFASLFASDKEEALAYLENDLRETDRLYTVMVGD